MHFTLLGDQLHISLGHIKGVVSHLFGRLLGILLAFGMEGKRFPFCGLDDRTNAPKHVTRQSGEVLVA